MAGQRVDYPVFLDLRNRKCVVVGGGTVAERKAVGLLAAGARVSVIAPVISESLEGLAADPRIHLLRREFHRSDVDGAALAFAATDTSSVNDEVVRAAGKKGVPVNRADPTGPGDFAVPATLRRGKLQVAVSTGGASPAYARMVRRRLEDVLGPEHGGMVEYLARLRPRVMARFPESPDRRKAVWDLLVNWETVDLVRRERWDELDRKVRACLS
ncbi:MAG: bifunctional precorrin-2 dehydrogenase/sirohydrochlorin ferrochelatase [Gemmatimonadota bacterium]|nr:bifunctional precorrin-2 dehydrogenase/sirohydrochlorin ferrochelatase [Gemmatimonadota bacterium]